MLVLSRLVDCKHVSLILICGLAVGERMVKCRQLVILGARYRVTSKPNVVNSLSRMAIVAGAVVEVIESISSPSLGPLTL